MKNSKVLGAGAQRGGVEFEPRVALSMDRKNLEIPWENKNSRVLGAGAQRGGVEFEPRAALSMERKTMEIPKENEEF